MSSFDVLPNELIDNLLSNYLNPIDTLNCSMALVGTRHEEFVTQKFLKPQLKIFAALDINLMKSLRKEIYEAWVHESHDDTEQIINIWKEFKPLKGIYYLFYGVFGFLNI